MLPPLKKELECKEEKIKTALERALTADAEDYDAAQVIVKKQKVERDNYANVSPRHAMPHPASLH
jgi:hypothetical protein